MGFSATAHNTLTDEDQEAMVSEMLLDYEDNDINKLVSRLAKPGGMIQPPPAAAAAVLPAPTLVPGVFISGRASANLKI